MRKGTSNPAVPATKRILGQALNWKYEYPFGKDVEETHFWANTEFNKSGKKMIYVTMFPKIQQLLATRQAKGYKKTTYNSGCPSLLTLWGEARIYLFSYKKFAWGKTRIF